MLELRPGTPDDGPGVRLVHLQAFPTVTEADLVEQLERDGDAAASIVAIEDGQVVGHILFSRMLAEADGEPLAAFGLAPISVLPARQGQGIGSRLVEAGLEAVEALGGEVVFVVGEPDYYGRFGFHASTAAPFESPYAGSYFQAKLLGGDRPVPQSGRADYAAAFAGLE